MPLSKLVFRPGINRDQTNYSNEGGWVDCDKVRFRSGFPEKMGGWTVQSSTPYAGVARELHVWNTADGGELFCIGTSDKIYVVAGNIVYDITPIRLVLSSPTISNIFTTTAGESIVLVTILNGAPFDGDYVTFTGATAVGGIPATALNREFKLFQVEGDTFKIDTGVLATTSVTGGGNALTATFEIHTGAPNVAQGFGWGAGPWTQVGWGQASTTPVFTPARIIFAQNINDDLLFVVRGVFATDPDNFYFWSYAAGLGGNRAGLLRNVPGAVAVPKRVENILFAPSGHLLALGCTAYDALGTPPDYTGEFDPVTVRWANVDADVGPQPEVWQPTLTNNAGFIRIESGSRIVAVANTRQETLIWTERSLTSLQFLGTDEVFGKQDLANAITIAGPNAVSSANNIVYWMGKDKFFQYSGRVDTLPCTVRAYVFEDINQSQSSIFFAASNAKYNEIIWFYCSATSAEIDRYVVFNYIDNIWYYGNLSRTAWVDTGLLENPIAAGGGWIYNHEVGHDDGQPNGAPALPLEAFITSSDVDIDDGDRFMLVRRVIPDVNFFGSDTLGPLGQVQEPSVEMTIATRNFPGAVAATTNQQNLAQTRPVAATATIDQYTNQVFIRARGRQISFKISSNTLGTQWQLGMPRVDARPDGGRA